MPAVVVIRHGLLVAAAGVPDGHLVVPWVPAQARADNGLVPGLLREGPLPPSR